MFLGEPAHKPTFLFTLPVCVVLGWRITARSRGRFHFRIEACRLRCTCSGASRARTRVRAGPGDAVSAARCFPSRLDLQGGGLEGALPLQPQPPAWLFCGGKAGGRIPQPLRGKAGGSEPLMLRDGSQSCGAGCWHRPGAARCCWLLRLQLKKCIYWGLCCHKGTNHPLPDPVGGLPSWPVLAPAAAETLAKLGKSLMRSPGGGLAAGLDPAQAGARCPSPHQSQPAAGPSCPALPRAPGPAPQNSLRGGGLGDAQPLQQPGDMSPPHPNQPAVCPRVGCVPHSVQMKAISWRSNSVGLVLTRRTAGTPS